MGAPSFLADLIVPGRTLRPVGDGIWSAMPDEGTIQRYDRRAAIYDRVVGNRLYNRLLWGSSPAAYKSFAAQAVQRGGGAMLDAGCGSLVFTARIYAESERPTVLLDQSLGMLEAARNRLASLGRHRPGNVILLQADMRDMPFRPDGFATVLSMGMMHLFEDGDAMLARMTRLVAPGGELRLSSLVSETWVGSRYLSALHRAGEVATPRTAHQLVTMLRRQDRLALTEHSVDGSMAFLVARR